MPVTLSIKNTPDEIVAKLKARAARNHRSLQGELMAIVTEAVQRSPPVTLNDFWNFAKEIGLESPNQSVEIIREMRDSRNK